MSNTGGRVLIAGATGYVGEAVRKAVRNTEHPVRLLVRSRSDAERFEAEGFETAIGDIVDPQSLFVAMDDVDRVINLVAIIKEREDVTFERINFQGTVNLVNAARQAAVEHFIQMSAIGAGNLPGYPYYYTKWRAESYVQDLMPRWTIIRPSIIFGPSSDLHEQFASQLADLVRSGPVVPVPGDGKARFQPIHVDDVGTAFGVAVTDATFESQILEIAGPDVLTYRQMLDAIAAELRVNKPILNMPVSLIRMGIKIMAPVPFIDLPVTAGQLDMLQIDNTTESNAAPTLLGRPPITFQDHLSFLHEYA